LADVFISYERSAEATALRAADALTNSGHTPWLDALLPVHRDYSEVLEEQLKASDVVLVLWSEAASGSQWVRAEADYARQEGKLVQAILDDSLPPMPFNRIQCARLAGWTGDASNPEWGKILEGVAQISGSPRPAAASPSPAPVVKAPAGPRRLFFRLGAAALVVR
jgi:adenylate cyclase